MSKVRTIARIKANLCPESHIKILEEKQQIIDKQQSRLYQFNKLFQQETKNETIFN